jgi:uncharacterized protein YijF (DUF1287 family)
MNKPAFFLLIFISCSATQHKQEKQNNPVVNLPSATTNKQEPEKIDDPFFAELCRYAYEQTLQKVTYDGSYYIIPYPNGDVPENIGVCTDVIIRAYRKTGYDLQKLIHEDMKIAHADYNKRRKTEKLDPNIDHRRTPNMQTFFKRQGAELPISNNARDYKPGDIVFWDVAYGHVGFVVNYKTHDKQRYMVVHNIGAGPQLEDFLFGAKITGHYRWKPKK